MNITKNNGISEKYRKWLDILNRDYSRPFSSKDVNIKLNLSLEKTRRLLVYLESRGWLSRLYRNHYITVPLGTINPHEYSEDSWITASGIFSPCYIGGWSAAEHWHFTDQIINDVTVFTSCRFRHTKTTVKSVTYILSHIKNNGFWGLVNVWRKNIKVQISDPSKTIVDILNYPFMAGGIRHASEIVKSYFDSEHRNDKTLLSFIEKSGNKTCYKRLGYIVEKLEINAPKIINSCLINISKGFSALDPDNKAKGRYIRKWNLKVNVEIV